MSRIMLWVVVLLFSYPLFAELKPKRVIEADGTEYTYEQLFSMENALSSMDSICAFLESFRNLTEAVEGKIPKEVMKKIGNTDWEMQNLGFTNMPQIVKGTLLKQDCLIRKLTFELTKAKVDAGEATTKDLEKAQKDLKQAEKAFQEFWDAYEVTD